MAGGRPGRRVDFAAPEASHTDLQKGCARRRPAPILRIGIVDRHGRDHKLKQVNEPDSQIMRAQANHIRYFELNVSAA